MPGFIALTSFLHMRMGALQGAPIAAFPVSGQAPTTKRALFGLRGRPIRWKRLFPGSNNERIRSKGSVFPW